MDPERWRKPEPYSVFRWRYATVSGSTVTLTGAGPVALGANQAPIGSYAAATATASIAVTAGTTLTASTVTETVAPGERGYLYAYTLAFRCNNIPRRIDLERNGTVSECNCGLLPGNDLARSAATPVTLTIQTSGNENPSSGGPFAPVALGFPLLPLADLKLIDRRLQQMPRLTLAVAVMALSLGAVLGLSGSGGSSSPANPSPESYTVAATETDVPTAAHSSVTITPNMQQTSVGEVKRVRLDIGSGEPVPASSTGQAAARLAARANKTKRAKVRCSSKLVRL